MTLQKSEMAARTWWSTVLNMPADQQPASASKIPAPVAVNLATGLQTITTLLNTEAFASQMATVGAAISELATSSRAAGGHPNLCHNCRARILPDADDCDAVSEPESEAKDPSPMLSASSVSTRPTTPTDDGTDDLDDSGHMPPDASPAGAGPRTAYLSKLRLTMAADEENEALRQIDCRDDIEDWIRDHVYEQKQALKWILTTAKCCPEDVWSEGFTRASMGMHRRELFRAIHAYDSTQEVLARYVEARFQGFRHTGCVSPWFWKELY